MSNIVGTVTFTTTGSKTVLLGFQPTWARVYVMGNTATNIYGHLSMGLIDENGNQFCGSFYQDASDGKTTPFDPKAIYHINSSGGVLMEGTFTTFLSNGIQFNMTTVNPDYQLLIEAGT